MSGRLLKACVVLGAGALGMLPGAEAAGDDRAGCFDAASKGQVLRDAHKLVEARDEFRVCAQRLCPASMQTDCAGWLEAVEKILPTIVPSATDAAGRDAVDVTVTMDGKLLTSGLNGQAIAVDPGVHAFRFERSDGTTAESRVLVKEGEVARSIALVLAGGGEKLEVDGGIPPGGGDVDAAAPLDGGAESDGGYGFAVDASLPSSGAGQRTAGIVLGVAGLAGLAVGGYFGINAFSEWSAAKSDCGASGCASGSLARNTADNAKNEASGSATASTIAFAAGGAALAAGVLLWATAPRTARAERSWSSALVPVLDTRAAGLALQGAW